MGTVRIEHNYRAHCTALHCTALHCTALHCTALHYTVLHCTALHCTTHKTIMEKDFQVNQIDWRVELVLSSAEVASLDLPLLVLQLSDGKQAGETMELELDRKELDRLMAHCRDIRDQLDKLNLH